MASRSEISERGEKLDDNYEIYTLRRDERNKKNIELELRRQQQKGAYWQRHKKECKEMFTKFFYKKQLLKTRLPKQSKLCKQQKLWEQPKRDRGTSLIINSGAST